MNCGVWQVFHKYIDQNRLMVCDVHVHMTIYICWMFIIVSHYRKRVDGDLAVSRAFGDFDYKKRDDLAPKDQKISCHPDIRVQARDPSQDDVLVLACDGVWDVMSSAESIDIVRDLYDSGEMNMKLVAEELVDIALNKG